MNKYLIPNLFYRDVYAIDYDSLLEKGIKAILFDIDNTLETFGHNKPSEKVAQLFNNLKSKGFLLGIVSNAGGGRSRRYAESADIFFSGRAHKPRTIGFERLAKEMNLKNKEIAMVGDQIFTDIKGGNKFGALTILVKPIDLSTEPWYTAIKRGPEKIVLRRLIKNGTEIPF